ncbi:MAG: isoprenyl transferase [Pyrinomonadaceae bacterium]|nr:isoprenyl transferase [Pyrinomonadaceae bacterium]MCX7639266.1 isoprenyl transferase [Pyrinomonadaceae bacterium]MDW8303512.1 isoprenyl transferase [Acidobacteriota bacterium]
MIKSFVGVVEPDSEESKLLSQIDLSRLPRHVAVIMDGNGRWAKIRGLPRIRGHREGAESVRVLLDTSARLGIKALTLYAFSTENWKRPKEEVSGLMEMLKFYLEKELDNVHKNNIRFQSIGKISRLDKDIQERIVNAEQKTRYNTGTILSVALNYGGRAEIVEAARKAMRRLIEEGKTPEDLSEDDIERNLYTYGLPEVDLLIRTSGEFRVSNFLLWQIAYSEIYVTPVLFPDFRRVEFLKAIIDYQKRERRFGGIGKITG